MIRFLIFTLALSSVACIAQAKPDHIKASDIKAEMLVDNCKHVNDEGDPIRNPDLMVCTYYMRGFLDGYAAAADGYGLCLPDGVDFGQMGKVVARYGEVHPNLLWEPAFLFTKQALTEAYPCH